MDLSSLLGSPDSALPGASCWSYKAEGGANVAFAFDEECSSASFLRGHLLRLRKCKATGKGGASTIDPSSQLLPHDPVDFVQEWMVPLLGKEYVIPGIRLKMNEVQLGDFQARLQEFSRGGLRPAHRLADSLDQKLGYGLLMLDHSLMPPSVVSRDATTPRSFCVELKPKCGILLPGDDDGDDSSGSKTRWCRYCMHQLLKAAEGLGAETDAATHPRALGELVSGYCPLHLYSRSLTRVQRALEALTSHPQNNFRLFVDGKPAFTHESAANFRASKLPSSVSDCDVTRGAAWSSEDCLSHLEETLEAAGFPSSPAFSGRSRVSFLIRILASVLCEDRLLSVLASAQALDRKGVAHVAEAYGRIRSRVVEADTTTTELSETEVAARVEKVCAEALARAGDGDGSSSASLASAEDASLLLDFMIAASAKDCSILLAFSLDEVEVSGEADTRPLDGEATPPTPAGGTEQLQWRVKRIRVDCGGKAYSCCYSVAVVDLDPKPFSKIPSYLSQDIEIKEAWRRLKGEEVMAAIGKTCGAQHDCSDG